MVSLPYRLTGGMPIGESAWVGTVAFGEYDVEALVPSTGTVGVWCAPPLYRFDSLHNHQMLFHLRLKVIDSSRHAMDFPIRKDTSSDTLEKRLWAAADQLRANSGLTSAQYSQPVLGLNAQARELESVIAKNAALILET